MNTLRYLLLMKLSFENKHLHRYEVPNKVNKLNAKRESLGYFYCTAGCAQNPTIFCSAKQFWPSNLPSNHKVPILLVLFAREGIMGEIKKRFAPWLP